MADYPTAKTTHDRSRRRELLDRYNRLHVQARRYAPANDTGPIWVNASTIVQSMMHERNHARHSLGCLQRSCSACEPHRVLSTNRLLRIGNSNCPFRFGRVLKTTDIDVQFCRRDGVCRREGRVLT